MALTGKKIVMGAATALFVAGIAAMAFMQDAEDVFEVDDSVVSETPTRPLLPAEQAALAKTLSPGLNDPSSVQWRWPPLDTRTFGKGRGQYCGYLNARNGEGVYLGFQPFLAAVRTARGQIRSGELALVATDDEALAVVRRMCAEAGYVIP
ncbi:hypothetical protein ACFFJB_09845 [Camelimonas abortus]|uniref:Uncharacterized protein n=1 Tax=Camelimonas abortus TaxID=1017184 RepID=A0ABV7LEP5_9HYPH